MNYMQRLRFHGYFGDMEKNMVCGVELTIYAAQLYLIFINAKAWMGA
jgi:hypothetical protein